MKTCLLFFSFFIVTIDAKSQINWLTPGARWSYEFSAFIGWGVTTLEVTNGDTMIGNFTCRKLLSTTVATEDGSGLDTFVETYYAFEDSNIVYAFEMGYWSIIYDFTKTAGDTLHYMFFGGLSPSPFIVDSVGTLDLNGISLPFQDIRFPDIFSPAGQFDEIRLVKGLGSIDSYFLHSHTILQPFDAPFYYFRCYEDPNVGLINLSHNQVDCNFIEGITSVEETTSLKTTFAPNPAKDLLTVKTNGQLVDKICIIDLVGIKRFTGSVASREAFNIDISNLESGMFIIIGMDTSGKILFKDKLLKY